MKIDILEVDKTRDSVNIENVVGSYFRIKDCSNDLKISGYTLWDSVYGSLYTNKERNTFFWSGCRLDKKDLNKGGDVFKFIMLMESCNFASAVKIAQTFINKKND